jgi:hypothetical protein
MERIKPFTTFLPPVITTIGGKTYVCPGWIEVPADTTLKEVQAVWTQDLSRQPKKEPDLVKTVTSKRTGEVYTVSVNNNKWNCTCKGKQFRPFQDCRHIKKIKAQLKSEKSLDSEVK